MFTQFLESGVFKISISLQKNFKTGVLQIFICSSKVAKSGLLQIYIFYQQNFKLGVLQIFIFPGKVAIVILECSMLPCGNLHKVLSKSRGHFEAHTPKMTKLFHIRAPCMLYIIGKLCNCFQFEYHFEPILKLVTLLFQITNFFINTFIEQYKIGLPNQTTKI